MESFTYVLIQKMIIHISELQKRKSSLIFSTILKYGCLFLLIYAAFLNMLKVLVLLCGPFTALLSICRVGWVAIHRQNLEKSGHLTLVREKSGKLGKVRAVVVCLCSGTSVAIVTK